MTPLQKILNDEALDKSVIEERTGRSRWTIWRWATGKTFPDPKTDVPILLDLFADQGLTFKGCYQSLFQNGQKNNKNQEGNS